MLLNKKVNKTGYKLNNIKILIIITYTLSTHIY